MSCNCKKKRNIEDKYGVPIEETIFSRLNTFGLKVFGFLFVFTIMIILVPLIVFTSVFKMFFSKNKTIVLPKFLGRFLKK